MRDDAFRAFLTPAQTPGGVSSYLANARRVERTLRIDLDSVELDENGVASLRVRLIQAGVEPKKASSCISAVRSYSIFRNGLSEQRECRANEKPAAVFHEPLSSRPSGPAPRGALALRSVPELMQMYAAIMSELRYRDVLRTGNGPVGDYAEMLFAETFGWKLSGNSNSGFDAMDDLGARYQIKARRLQSRSASRQLGAIRRLPDRPFDFLAVLLFDGNMAVHRAAIVPIEIVSDVAKWTEHTNSWRVIMPDTVLAQLGVRDVTAKIRATVAGVSNIS